MQDNVAIHVFGKPMLLWTVCLVATGCQVHWHKIPTSAAPPSIPQVQLWLCIPVSVSYHPAHVVHFCLVDLIVEAHAAPSFVQLQSVKDPDHTCCCLEAHAGDISIMRYLQKIWAGTYAIPHQMQSNTSCYTRLFILHPSDGVSASLQSCL